MVPIDMKLWVLVVIAMLCACGCVTVKKTYTHEVTPTATMWMVNEKEVADLTPQEQETWKGIVR